MTAPVKVRSKIITIFGTRPEVIKLAPVIRQFEARSLEFETINVSSGQHRDILYPFLRLFDIRVDYDLQVMEPYQTPNRVCARVLTALDPILAATKPDLMVVQGDTTTAMTGALAAFHWRIPIAHVEAGLRTGNDHSPYPEEMNRRLITRLATYHFAATPRNRETLISEGVAEERVFLTGNPIVDALRWIMKQAEPTAPALRDALAATRGLKRLVLTTHRRESFGNVMAANLGVLRRFVETHSDVALIFPVHPNPSVAGPAAEILGGHARIHLIEPLDYRSFIDLIAESWLVVSDSGGVQEEAPTLKRPVLILRECTERPEAVESGVARLVGDSPERLGGMLGEAYRGCEWMRRIGAAVNPFGKGDSGELIVDIVGNLLSTKRNG